MKTNHKKLISLICVAALALSEPAGGRIALAAENVNVLASPSDGYTGDALDADCNLIAESSSDASVQTEEDARRASEILYEAVVPDNSDSISDSTSDSISEDYASSVSTASGVTPSMCAADYWYSKNSTSGIGIDTVLINKDEIISLNKQMLAAPGANMNDLENLPATDDADKRRELLAKAALTAVKKTTVYADGEAKTVAEYYKEFADAIEATGLTGSSVNAMYAVTTTRTTLNNIPTNSYIGYSATDSDDEKVLSALLVGEPFVAYQKVTVGSDVFYWGYANNCTGWVNASDIAICKDRSEWLDAWKIDPKADDFLVVTSNKIVLEPSVYKPELSEVKLTFATILKSVPEDKYPASIAERGTWNNHVVYLPVRDADGKYIKSMALISQHYEVSLGFPAMTQANILNFAFNNLGDRYGWGGMLDSMDCSLLTRNVYRCFGLEIPRNTNWQQLIPDRKIDLTALNEEDKLRTISLMPAGTLLYFPGHTMIYTGMDDATGSPMAYVISDTGSVADSTGDPTIKSIYSVILNPLTARRKSGNTWLKELTTAMLPISDAYVSTVRANIAATSTEDEPAEIIPYAEGQTYASSKDTLPLETFLGTTSNIFISFCNVDPPKAETLTATVVKGSKLTTKVPVKAVRCDKAVATATISKANSLATLTLKKSGPVTFEMADGSTYKVDFTVQSPAAQTAAVKNLVKSAKDNSSDTLILDIGTLFGTQIDGGTLSIAKQTGSVAGIAENALVLNLKNTGSVKVSYKYLNKTYSMSINVK